MSLFFFSATFLTLFLHPATYALLKSDVARRDHVSVATDAGSRIVNFIVNFIRDGTVFA